MADGGDLADVLFDVPEVADALIAARRDVRDRPHDGDAQRRYSAALRNALRDDDWDDDEPHYALLDELLGRLVDEGEGK